MINMHTPIEIRHNILKQYQRNYIEVKTELYICLKLTFYENSSQKELGVHFKGVSFEGLGVQMTPCWLRLSVYTVADTEGV